MATIDQLTAVDSVVSADQIPIYSSTNGDARKASIAVVSDYIESLLSVNDNKTTQYSAPSATSFTVAVSNSGNSTWLVLTPTAGFAAGTLTLPEVSVCTDKQELLVNCTQSVTTLTIGGNGSTVTGAPTTLAANAYFRLRFDLATKSWYRVG